MTDVWDGALLCFWLACKHLHEMKRNTDVSSSSVSSSLRIRRTQTHADKWSHFSSGCIRICIWQQHNLSFQLSCDFLISSAKLFQLCVFGIVLYWTPVGTWCVLNSLDSSHVCQAGEEQEGKLDVWLRDGGKGRWGGITPHFFKQFYQCGQI